MREHNWKLGLIGKGDYKCGDIWSNELMVLGKKKGKMAKQGNAGLCLEGMEWTHRKLGAPG